MKPEEQIEAIARLEGQTFPYGIQVYQDRDGHWTTCDMHGSMARKQLFLQSYNEIISLVVKQCNEKGWSRFTSELILIRRCKPHQLDPMFMVQMALRATPAQLCEALLRATNLWKDSDIK